MKDDAEQVTPTQEEIMAGLLGEQEPAEVPTQQEIMAGLLGEQPQKTKKPARLVRRRRPTNRRSGA